MQGFNGLSLFSVLLLMALGLAIIFGQMGVINMAHGEFMTIGAYTTYLSSHLFETHLRACYSCYFFFAMVSPSSSPPRSGCWSNAADPAPLQAAARHLLATWGLSLIMQQAFRSIFGATEVSATLPDWLMGSLTRRPSTSTSRSTACSSWA